MNNFGRADRLRLTGFVSVAGFAVMVVSCHRRQQSTELPPVPVAALTDLPTLAPAAPQSAMPLGIEPLPARPEKLITLTGEWDVRLALEEIARAAGYSLSVSPKIVPKKVRLSLVNVPAPDALKAVLDAGQLTLGTGQGPKVPWNPSVVFYQLPVNVDSLSVDAIMKRFGISRDLAEMMVQARKP
jgi:hypothetical protein